MSVFHRGTHEIEMVREEHGHVGGVDAGTPGKKVILVGDDSGLIGALHELVSRLAPLAGAMSPTAQLRVTQTAVPSTAVTGPITSAQFIATYNVGGVNYTSRVAIENNAAVQSNINNCIGA